jgi:hypothetical protein
MYHSQLNRSGTGTNHPLQNQTYSNMVGQPGWNSNPFGTMGHFEAGMGAHTNMFGMHGPAGYSRTEMPGDKQDIRGYRPQPQTTHYN